MTQQGEGFGVITDIQVEPDDNICTFLLLMEIYIE
jgi:hypothetical protein